MYILYLDESGSIDSSSSSFVLAGIAVHENSLHWFSSQLDNIVITNLPGAPDAELHATDILGGKKYGVKYGEKK